MEADKIRSHKPVLIEKALDKQLGLSNWPFENAAHEILIGFRTIIGSVLTDGYLFYFEKP